MDRIDKLTEYFSQFPGIGPRSARRFVYYLLTKPKTYHQELADLIRDLEQVTNRCSECFRFYTADGQHDRCPICSDKNRENIIMVVEKDVDLENVERSDAFTGTYFVLGGTVPVLEKEPQKRVRSNELRKHIQTKDPDEVIIATSANPDGDTTAQYIRGELKQAFPALKVSLLGRGLSTGSELEYSDKETIRNAFENRV